MKKNTQTPILEDGKTEKLVDALIAGTVAPSNPYIATALDALRGHMAQTSFEMKRLNQARKLVLDLETSIMTSQGSVSAAKRMLISFIGMEDANKTEEAGAKPKE